LEKAGGGNEASTPKIVIEAKEKKKGYHAEAEEEGDAKTLIEGHGTLGALPFYNKENKRRLENEKEGHLKQKKR